MIEIKEGPELDRLVADAIGISFDREDPRGVVIELGEAIHPYMPAMWSPTMVFNPSVDLTAAFSAAEKVGLFEDYQLRKYRAVERRWDMIQKDNDWHTTPQAPTPALAICAAILILKEEKPKCEPPVAEYTCKHCRDTWIGEPEDRGLEHLPYCSGICKRAAEKTERLQRAIRWYFSLNPDHDECELIGRCILPLPDDIRRTIIEECEAAEGE